MVKRQNKIGFIITIICIINISNISTDEFKPTQCSPSKLDQCHSIYESCEQIGPSSSSGLCNCNPGTQRQGSDMKCLPTNPILPDTPTSPASSVPSSSLLPQYESSHVAAGILIPLVLVALALGLIYAGKRYQWVQRLRSMRQRRYDEVQFGEAEDDPPLA